MAQLNALQIEQHDWARLVAVAMNVSFCNSHSRWHHALVAAQTLTCSHHESFACWLEIVIRRLKVFEFVKNQHAIVGRGWKVHKVKIVKTLLDFSRSNIAIVKQLWRVLFALVVRIDPLNTPLKVIANERQQL